MYILHSTLSCIFLFHIFVTFYGGDSVNPPLTTTTTTTTTNTNGLLAAVVQGLERSWSVPSEPCIEHYCEDGVEKTKDLREECTCPQVRQHQGRLLHVNDGANAPWKK